VTDQGKTSGEPRLAIKCNHGYPFVEKANSTPEGQRQYAKDVANYVAGNYPNLDGFVLFETMRRYEIDFPTRWEKTTRKDLDQSAPEVNVVGV
jgi:hypothetical protein